jgi:hypothetical protein
MEVKSQMAKRVFLTAALFLFCWPGPPPARSTSLARMDLRELARRSAYVARVQCLSSTNWPDARLAWTLTSFEVTDSWKGHPPEQFTIRLPGGETAGSRVTVEGAPRFVAGEEAVLFLEPGKGRQMNIVSWAQGTFRIRRDPRSGLEEATQDTAGVQLFDARGGQWSSGALHRLPVANLRALVARALAEAPR